MWSEYTYADDSKLNGYEFNFETGQENKVEVRKIERERGVDYKKASRKFFL